MTRRKGERTAARNGRDLPNVVSLMVPENGFGKALDAIFAFHRV